MSRLIKTSITISSLRAEKARLALKQKELEGQIRVLSVKANGGADRLLGRATMELIRAGQQFDTAALLATAKSIARSSDRDALLVLNERLVAATGTPELPSSEPSGDERIGPDEPGDAAPDPTVKPIGQEEAVPTRTGHSSWSGGMRRTRPAISSEANDDS